MRHNLTNLAKQLRKNSTEAERILWNRLRSRQIDGIKFRRQQPIEDYIADFASLEKRLIIELDGGQHAEAADKDQLRDEALRAAGFRVIRFWNNDILENLDGVLQEIGKACSR